MQISVTGRHVKVTDAIKNYAYEQVEHDLAKYDRIESVHVILDVEKFRQMAEVVIQAKNHIRVEAEDTSEDMYVSIDSAIAKAEKQMHKLRDKIQDHKSVEGLGHLERDIQDEQI
ncbi:MAG: ribosome-associated translation inhibitor RaiA [Desulfatiglandaceae bacterium]